MSSPLSPPNQLGAHAALEQRRIVREHGREDLHVGGRREDPSQLGRQDHTGAGCTRSAPSAPGKTFADLRRVDLMLVSPHPFLLCAPNGLDSSVFPWMTDTCNRAISGREYASSRTATPARTSPCFLRTKSLSSEGHGLPAPVGVARRLRDSAPCSSRIRPHTSRSSVRHVPRLHPTTPRSSCFHPGRA